MKQLNMFDILNEKYKIKKPIKLIELFAGIGSQAKAIKRLGIPFQHHKICEWAIPSIIGYDAIHTFDNKNYLKDMSEKELNKYLFQKGISRDYNEPMKLDQVERLSFEKKKQIYNSIIRTNNLVNITTSKGEDLEITNTEEYEYIMTYSFPCQDLSLAGKGAGMSKGGNTRSGLLWEVERLLKETKNKPQILLMENVPEVIGKNNINDFKLWIDFLESLGYSNFVETLNAKDYGVPQNRKRVFMISIFGDYNYNFPSKKELKLKLKDFLEKEVDEKYYFSNKQIEDVSRWKAFEKPLEHLDDEIMGTFTTRSGAYASSMKLVRENKEIDNFIAMPENTQKGYVEAREGDGVYINRPEQKRGVVQKQMVQTLSTQPQNDLGVVVLGNCSLSSKKLEEQFNETVDFRNLKEKLCDELIESEVVEENYVINHSYTNKSKNINSRIKLTDYIETKDGFVPTLTTRPDILGVVVLGNYSPSNHNASRIVDVNGVAPTFMENHGTITAIIENQSNYEGTFQYAKSDSFMGKKDRFTPNKETADTILTSQKEGVVVSVFTESNKKMITEEGNIKRYIDSDIVDIFEEGDSADLSFQNGYGKGNRVQKEKAPTLAIASINQIVTKTQTLRIRKLTPKEAIMLMGFDEEDYLKLSKTLSDNQIYHCAGDSIVVNVLENIFKELI